MSTRSRNLHRIRRARPTARTPRGGATAFDLCVAVHPDPEVASARAGTATHAGIARTTGWMTDRRHRDLPGGPQLLLLVHVDAVARFHGGWCGLDVVGEQSARGTRVVAIIRPGDRDSAVHAVSAGAHAVLESASSPAVIAALEPILNAPDSVRPVGDPQVPVPIIEPWFAARYGADWREWMETAAVIVVGGGSRVDQAQRLAAALGVSEVAALRRLRRLDGLLCGEIHGDPQVLSAEARLILRQLARQREITVAPSVDRSLRRALQAVETDPRLLERAGLDEFAIRDLQAVDQEERALDAAGRPGQGRPEAGAWRARRAIAIGRVAERRGIELAEKLRERERLERTLQDAVIAIHAVLDDPPGSGLRLIPRTKPRAGDNVASRRQ